MCKWSILITKQAQKDYQKLSAAKLQKKVDFLLDAIESDLFESYPSFKKLVDNLHGFYSRRINQKHRLIYSVDETNRRVKVVRMWTHYGE